jgi:hypothetical protein
MLCPPACRTRLSILACILMAGLGRAQSTTWYVDANAAPPGNGTLASPYASIQYAIDQPTTVAGDVLLAAPGLYSETVDVDKTVTVRSSGGPLATSIQGTQPGFVVRLAASGQAAIEGFTILGHSVHATDGVHLVKGFVRGCIVRDHRKDGGSGGTGIDAAFDDTFSGGISRCTILNNQGIGIFGGYPFFDLAHVSDTIAYGNGSDLVMTRPSYCLWGSGTNNVAGPGNLEGVDPKLWDLATSNPRLGPLSPCIDAGSPGLPPDPDSSPADRGAVPFDALYLPPIATYCTGKVNSQGCAASIGASGAAGASMTSSAPFLVTCNGVVEGVPGLMFWGRAPRAAPFMGGFHCVQPPTPRCAAQLAGSSGSPCSGTFSFDFNAYAQSGLNPTLAAGQVIRAQYWYRDPSDPAGFGAATSNAIEFALGL